MPYVAADAYDEASVVPALRGDYQALRPPLLPLLVACTTYILRESGAGDRSGRSRRFLDPCVPSEMDYQVDTHFVPFVDSTPTYRRVETSGMAYRVPAARGNDAELA